MSNSLDQWLKRTCVCPHPDRRECVRVRWHQTDCQPGLEPDQDEYCDCMCHDQDYDDDDEE